MVDPRSSLPVARSKPPKLPAPPARVATETLARSTGRLDLAAPDWRQIDLDDIALSLSRIPRFLGQTWRTISVLEHSLAVSRMVPPRHRLAALLHDAREAYLGDITRPVIATLNRRLEQKAGAGGLFSAMVEALGRDLDRVIACAVLAEFVGKPDAWVWMCANKMAAAMIAEPVTSADDLACLLELKLFGRASPDPALRPEAWQHYARTEPEPSALRIEWLRAVRAEAVAFLAAQQGGVA